jgi:hypothetical protein
MQACKCSSKIASHKTAIGCKLANALARSPATRQQSECSSKIASHKTAVGCKLANALASSGALALIHLERQVLNTGVCLATFQNDFEVVE